MFGKNFQDFYQKEFLRLLKNIDRKHEIRSFDVEDEIKDVISKSVEAMQKDEEEKKLNNSPIISEKTGNPIPKEKNQQEK